jgi:glucose/arabinose dehydrogenase
MPAQWSLRTRVGIVVLAAFALAIPRPVSAEESPKGDTETLALSAPPDVRVRVIATFAQGDQEPVRIASNPASGRLYALGGGGDVSLLDVESRSKRRVLIGKDYVASPAGQDENIPFPVDVAVVNAPIKLRTTLCLGLAFDREGRLYIVANVQVPGPVYVNRVDIYRTTVDADGLPATPTLWTQFSYPYGVGGFNHGACRIAQGPDGMIYLGSGSRTDHGEAGEDPKISRLGEAPHPDIPGGEYTACILRFDPSRGQQTPEVYSRGNRNPFGFDWDDQGRLLDAEHGPMADHPEELNLIERGKHYGFPYVFGDGETPAYSDRPLPPRQLRFVAPIKNVGPAGLLGINPMYSLTPHSAPGGLLFYRGGRLPARYEKSFFLARFGNLVNYNRIGFDVLNIRLESRDGAIVARTERFLDHLGRPIDLALSGGRLYVLEYGRQTETVGPNSASFATGGRVLEVTSAR